MFDAEPREWTTFAAGLTPVVVASVIVMTVVVAGIGAVPALLRLATRTSDPAAPDFTTLATPGLRAAIAVTTVAAAVPLVGWTPPPVWCAWLGMITLGPVLGWIDAATMWLPLRLTHLLWLLTGIGVLAGAGLAAGVGGGDPWWQLLLGAGVGAAAVGGFFAVVWKLGKGALGFGDVRLAVAMGAATGAAGLTVALVAVVIGTLTAAAWAVIRSIRGRREPFPYGPFLVVGAFLAPLFG